MMRSPKKKKDPWKRDLPYLTAGEKAMFKGMVARGEVSFFRVTGCKVCDADIPPFKEYCCKEHYLEKEGSVEDEQQDEDSIEWELD